MVKIKPGDVIRDFTQTDPEMKNIWVIGGSLYVRYVVVSIQKTTITALRMASPNHSENEFKQFSNDQITKASQTIGIFEVKL